MIFFNFFTSYPVITNRVGIILERNLNASTKFINAVVVNVLTTFLLSLCKVESLN